MEQDFNEQNNKHEENIDNTTDAERTASEADEQSDVPVEETPCAVDYNAENEDVSQPVSNLGHYPDDEPDDSVSVTFSSDAKLAELEQEIDEAVEEFADGEARENKERSLESTNDECSECELETPATTLTRDQIVEAVLFSSDGPLPGAKVASVIGAISSKEIREIIDRLNNNYCQWNCSFRIQEIAGGFQMMTCPEYATYLQQLYKVRSESKLSGAALETLAVIAYKQPVLRAEIEAIRGVACGEMIRTLMEKDLIKIVGRAEELGRPMLYGTTKRFLQVFGLGSLEDLPKVPELLPPTRAAKPQPEKSEETPITGEPEQPLVQSTDPELESTLAPQAMPEQPAQEVQDDVPLESTSESESSLDDQSSDSPADEPDEDADQKVE